ncbi:MAG: helix-turn-helix domain-containing protein [Acidobacteriia bacterium]|nr:helix-turn-helix domain-containing protein [Terriglobia bacterium]
MASTVTTVPLISLLCTRIGFNLGFENIMDPKTDRHAHDEKAAMLSNGLIGRRLLNVREAAQYLGLEVDTVYKKARLRELPCVKVGRALRFDLQALERFVEQHTIETID